MERLRQVEKRGATIISCANFSGPNVMEAVTDVREQSTSPLADAVIAKMQVGPREDLGRTGPSAGLRPTGGTTSPSRLRAPLQGRSTDSDGAPFRSPPLAAGIEGSLFGEQGFSAVGSLRSPGPTCNSPIETAITTRQDVCRSHLLAA